MKPLIPTNEVKGTFCSEDAARQAMISLFTAMNEPNHTLREAAARIELSGAQVIISWNNRPTLHPIIRQILRNLDADVSKKVERYCS